VIDSVRSWGNWDLTAEGIYYIDRRKGQSSPNPWVVRFFDFDDGSTIEIAELNYVPQGVPALSVTADGRWLLSAQVQREADIMLVEDFR
jgi:hypothetical protein